MEPFANLRQEGTVMHLGQDAGACLDGAGIYYAPAEGIVAWIQLGGDAGTTLVILHQLPGGRLVNGVLMHAGDRGLRPGGDRVAPGQLLATIGLSFSIENGGRFAHLHYGLYPGSFDPRHQYAYRPAASGSDGWLDQADSCPPGWTGRGPWCPT